MKKRFSSSRCVTSRPPFLESGEVEGGPLAVLVHDQPRGMEHGPDLGKLRLRLDHVCPSGRRKNRDPRVATRDGRQVSPVELSDARVAGRVQHAQLPASGLSLMDRERCPGEDGYAPVYEALDPLVRKPVPVAIVEQDGNQRAFGRPCTLHDVGSQVHADVGFAFRVEADLDLSTEVVLLAEIEVSL
jgi:hypothetical protein